MTHREIIKPRIVTGTRTPSSDTEVGEWNKYFPLTVAVFRTGDEQVANARIYPTTHAENDRKSTFSRAITIIKYKTKSSKSTHLP